jgi:hypothetical protein
MPSMPLQSPLCPGTPASSKNHFQQVLRLMRTRSILYTFLLLVSSFGMQLRAQHPAGPHRPATVPEGYLVTPNGYFHPSCVKLVAKGEKLVDGNIQHLDGSIEQVQPCAYPRYNNGGEEVAAGASKVPSPEWTQTGYIDTVQATAPPETPYGELYAQWTVPPLPTTNDNQALALFPGFQDRINVQTILQPILQYYNGGWSIVAENCCVYGVAYASTPVGVSAGDTIIGSVGMDCAFGTPSCATWNIDVYDWTSGASTALPTTSSYGQTFDWAFGFALETNEVVQCSDYPPNDNIQASIYLYDYNDNYISPPDWNVVYAPPGTVLSPECNYGGQVTSNLPNYPSVLTLTWATQPSFWISASPYALTVAQDGAGTYTIAVNDQNGFTGGVTLSASGLPSGVTAAFTPNPTTGTSILTLTASSAAIVGYYLVTVTGTSGSLTASTTIGLTIGLPFSPSASPAVLTIAQGQAGTYTIAVNDQNGFTGSVTLSASGLPSGVTAKFAPNPTTGTSQLTLTASATAAAGTYTPTLTGTAGGVRASTSFTLTIGCSPTAIVPYISVNGGSTWTQESSATVASTTTDVDLGPQPTSGGSWRWTGPNRYTSTSRQINRIPLTVGTDSYVATYTNACGSTSNETFTITVK